jgi:hypothetical protein
MDGDIPDVREYHLISLEIFMIMYSVEDAEQVFLHEGGQSWISAFFWIYPTLLGTMQHDILGTNYNTTQCSQGFHKEFPESNCIRGSL